MSRIFFKVILVIFFLGNAVEIFAQDSLVIYTKRGFTGDRPKIGLVLSGGGAKGIAHVGFLRVMEEAGIHPDYIAGTSMGSLVGALYAIGFSVDSIESMIYSQNWDEVLSNKVSYRSVNMEEKKEYGEYFAELPFYGWKPSLPAGAIKGQGLELLFEKLTMSTAGITSFDSLYIPYRAVATDLLTGNAYVFSEGPLAIAMRSSMSIPTIIQPIKYKGMLLVDGGLVENFPVSVVKDMGADIVIGVYTGGQFLPEEDLTSMLAILKQSSLLGGIIDAKKQRKNVDIYVEPYLNDMSASDFNKGSKFYKRGYDAAMKKMPELKKLAQYMKQFNVESKERPKLIDSAYVNDVGFSTIKNEKYAKLAYKMLESDTNVWVDYGNVKEKVDQLYGTRLFQKVGYHFEATDSTQGAKLVYDILERKPKYLNFALQYRNESKIGLIAGLTFRNVILPMSKLEMKVRLSEFPAAKVRYFSYLGYTTKFGTSFSYNFYATDVPVYNQRTLSAHYKRYTNSLNAGFSFFPSIGSSISLMGRYEMIKYQKLIDPEVPYISSIYENGWFMGLAFDYNTFDSKYFTSKGSRFKLKAETNLDTQEKYLIEGDSIAANPGMDDKISFFTESFFQLSLLFDNYEKLSPKWVMSNAFFAVATTLPDMELVHTYLVGGMFPADPNQIPFYGIPENTIFMNNGMIYRLGFRYQVVNKLYVSAKINALFDAKDVTEILDIHSDESYFGNPDNYIMGVGAEVSYRSPIGPISVGAAINDAYGGVWSHIRLGFVF